MKLNYKITATLFGLLLTAFSFGQTNEPIEYLGVAKQIKFGNDTVNLTWTSHPADNYYKQEYLAKNDTIEKFKRLVLLEALTGAIKIKDIVAAKVSELKKMKASNPVVNYETFEKDGEFMLDFLISENTPDGKYLSIVERNVYRYKSVIDKNGQKCLLLFGVSERAYGDDIDKFFLNLKEHRLDLINSVGAFELPEITIAK